MVKNKNMNDMSDNKNNNISNNVINKLNDNGHKSISKRELGLIGENYAVNYLRELNFIILERNFRFSRFGEIDIIASENEYICFIEVKTRTSNLFGMPAESVNINKQKKIKMLAQIYLKGKELFNKNVRFDVVEVFIEHVCSSRLYSSVEDNKGNNIVIKQVNLIRNAF